MAERKKTMGKAPSQSEDSETQQAKPTRARRTSPNREKVKMKTETELLEESFAALAPRGEELAARFYERLFEQYPQVKPLFEGISIAGQQKKLLASLVLLVQNLHKPEVLKDYLMGLGARHVHYGVTAEQYPLVAENLLTVMEEFAGKLWTAEVKQAWTNTLNSVATIMLEAYEPREADEMAISKPEVEQELAVMRSAVDGASTALMMCDKDLVITYANPAVISLLENRLDELRKVFPGLDLNKLIGTCIDDFHKNAALQRGILADVKKLPYQTQIQVLDLWFDLNATAILDSDGNYAGNMVEWKDVTSEKAKEQEVARLSGTVNGAMTAIMMVDRDFNVTYANDATITMLTEHEETLKKAFPGFSVKNLVGSNIDSYHKNPEHQRKLLADPNNLPYSTDIEVGPLSFNLNVTAIMDAEGNYIGNGLEWADITEKKARELDVARLQSAISGASSALMMCDENRVITYANPAVMSLLANRVSELRKVFPGLDLNKIVGTCIDDFHKDPSLQIKILQDVDNLPYRTQIQLLDLHFDLNATAIVDANGNYMGNMVEWKDITEQVIGEQAVQSLIQSAQVGELKERIDATGYEGFMKGVADGVNNIMDAVLMPVEETIAVAQALSKGDLTQTVDGDFQGMFADLAEALNTSVKQMAETVREITEAAGSVSTAASEISEGNIDLSQRTEEQASSLEETASSMEELTSTVRQNSDNARQANQLATGAREQAEKGGTVIREAIEAMTAISASSKKVTDIIGVIDEIAFQTNLLALNAAVEAARAGEQGRGFAVVASEVRNLAQRSASAAKEIKELINDSGEKVKEGSMLVDDSGRTLEEIVASSKKVGDIISEIAAAGAEQTQGIEQVNKAVTQMDEMTQQNAALVEEAAAASESMEEQGKNLQRMMAFFTVGGETKELTPKSVSTTEPVEAAPKAKPKAAAPKAKPKAAPKAASTETDDEWDEF